MATLISNIGCVVLFFDSIKKRIYRLLVNSKFSNHLSQCAYSVRKNNNAKLNNKKKITIRHKLRIIKYDVLKFIFT